MRTNFFKNSVSTILEKDKQQHLPATTGKLLAVILAISLWLETNLAIQMCTI